MNSSEAGSDPGVVFRLGQWLVDADACTLSDTGANTDPVKITPRSMEVLVYLATHSGRVVSSQELLDTLWTSITSDHAVHKAIAELRGAVQDNAAERSFIVTVPKRGYKLSVEPKPITSSVGGRWQHFLSGFKPQGFEAQDPASALSSRGVKLAAASVSVVIISLTILLWNAGSLLDNEGDAVLVGVLPFRIEAGNDDDNRFLADGLTNSLLSGLSKLTQLNIVSLPHDPRFSTSTRSASEIGAELGIDQILEGILMQVHDRVRVNVRLVRVADGVQLYSDQFDMAEQDIFTVQDTIVSHIVDSLSIHLDESERRNMLDWGTTNAIAYQHFMQGEFYNNQFNPGDFERAIEHHSTAIELDPEFENAYLGLATAANNLAVYSRMDKIAKLRELVADVHRRVATLDRDSPTLHSIQAIESRMSGINHLEQEATLREQVLSESPPDYALAHYALFLIGARLFDEARQYLDLAAEVDPFEISPDEIWSYRADIATPAEEVLIRKRQLQERPNHIGILGTVGRNLTLEGRLDEAHTYINRQRELDTEGVSAHLTAVVTGVLTGKLQADSEQVQALYAQGPDYNFSNGVLAFMLGDFATGREFWLALQPVQKRKLRNLVYAVEKFFPESILEQPRYQKLLEELGVGKSWQHRLMQGVLEMESVTGVSLSPEAREALSRDELMSRNNLWPEAVWTEIDGRLAEPANL